MDDNNATLWRPGDNRMGHWLMVDLGSPQRVRRTETQFEYGTWFYQYLIESSLDGQTWKTFADRRQNTRWGSPMVDDGDVEARYLRLTVTGTEYPGLFGAVWNFKAFADAPADPLLAMADKAFDQVHRADERPAEPTSPLAVPRPAWDPHGGRHRCPAHPPRRRRSPTRRADRRLDQPGHARRRVPQPRRQARRRHGRRPQGRAILRQANPHRFVSRAARRWPATAASPSPPGCNNPEIGESECLVSWAGRGGPDATTAQFGYGTHPEFGAVGHWGFADMGFRGAPPKAGPWHHLAVVFDGVIERVYVDGQLNNCRGQDAAHARRAARSTSARPNRARSTSTATSPRCASMTGAERDRK